MMEGRWMTRNITIPYVCGIWRSIIKGWEDLSRHVPLKVGGGSEVGIGAYKCCGDNELREVFPNMYIRLACQKEIPSNKFVDLMRKFIEI